MPWVVVGGGSAGCVVAGRLAEAGHDVTLVEAGVVAPPVAASFLDTMAAPGALFDGPEVRGRGLGGSGAINGMVATPGDPEQYAAWGWTDWADALARVRVPREPAAVLGAVDEALLAAAPDATVAMLTTRHGRRVTSADVYLDGVAVRAGVEAVAIERDGARATGVRLADGHVVGADAVAVAGGTHGTPALLRASGCAHPGLGIVRNHLGLPVTLHLRHGGDVHAPVTGALVRRGDVQVTAMNHLGPEQPGRAMLLATILRPVASGADVAAARSLVTAIVTAPAFTAILDGHAIDPPGGVHHATSSCRIGVVADDDGRVDGFANVHVVDASAFPDVPAANTYLPTLALAERLAARLVARG